MELFVSNLNTEVRDDDLYQLFIKFGEVQSVIIIKDTFTNICRGFAFIKMKELEAEDAVRHLNNTLFMQRSINVHVATIKQIHTYNTYLK
ncbi:MAG TPA: RNA-binding protein [Flavipsychrobacter sp.]|nr:RNA-binding protein [Flavipsychrobacter sp.]